MKGSMKRVLIICVVVVLAAGGVWAAKSFLAGRHGGHAAEQKAMYHCPMHPTYLSDRPGDCPICGMKLVEIEQTETTASSEGAAHEAHEGSHGMEGSHGAQSGPAPATGGSICLFHNCPMLQEGRMCPMLVISEDGTIPDCPVCKQHLSEADVIPVEQIQDITGYTAVTLSSKKQQLIGIRTAKLEKNLSRKMIRTVGRIAYDPELYQAQEEYLEALRARGKAESGKTPEIAERAAKLVESARTRLELLGLNAELIDEIETQSAPDKSLLLAAPGGTVWMYGPIYEHDLDVVKAGQTVRVTAENVIPGKTFAGVIRSIDPVLDPKTRSLQIRTQLENPGGLLKPNVYVNAEIEITLGDQLLIPESAVLDSGERRIAFVARGGGVFEPRLLKLGPKLEDAYVVLSGVSEGEEVVDQAAFFVDSESKLKAAIGEMSEGHQHGG